MKTIAYEGELSKSTIMWPCFLSKMVLFSDIGQLDYIELSLLEKIPNVAMLHVVQCSICMVQERIPSSYLKSLLLS